MTGHDDEIFEIDGVTYRSLDDVPQPYQDSIASLMADRDGNGVPDLVERGSHQIVDRTESYQVDGVTYASLEDLPEPQRSAVRHAFEHDRPAPVAPAPTRPPKSIISSTGWSNRSKLLIAFVTVDAIVMAAVVWLIVH